MAGVNAGLARLSDEDRQVVESWLSEFGQDWHEGRLAEQIGRLPPQGNRLRLAALVEMVKIDLDRQWQLGRRACIEGYLRAYPELGPIDSVPPDLIVKEYEVRCQAGASPEVTTFLKRFPQQAEQLRPLLGQARQSGTTSRPAPKGQNTARANTPLLGTAHAPGTPAKLPERFGRYLIRKRLGQGGMGSVYLAHDTELDRDVALKVPHLSSADGPEVLQRFYREARAAATLQHPHICPVHDVGQIDNVPYLTMSYIDGLPLSKVLERGKPLSQRKVAELVRKLALALQEAHAKGIVHRDLKPSNIMLNKRGEPVVMDFGLVLRVDQADARITKSGAALGTPAYMPPEQVRGATAEMGPACDIYSLGVILYELLSGQLPFEGPYLAVCAQILTGEAPPPSSHRPGVDTTLEAICRKAMAKKAQDRYATAGELAAALAGHLRSGSQPPGPQPSGDPTAGRSPVSVSARSKQSESSAPSPFSGLALQRESGSGVSRHPHEASAGGSRLGSRWLWITAGSAAALVILGIIVYVSTDYGKIRIKINDANAAAQVNDPLPVTVPAPPAPEPIKEQPNKGAPAQPRVPLIRDIIANNGSWRVEGNEVVQDFEAEPAWLLFGSSDWTDYDYEVEALRLRGRGDASFIIPFRARLGNQWQFNVGAGANAWRLLQLVQDGNFITQPVATGSGQGRDGEWRRVLIKVRGPHIQCFLDGALVFDERHEQHPNGGVGLQTHQTAARFRNLKVTAPDGTVLFEGVPDLPQP